MAESSHGDSAQREATSDDDQPQAPVEPGWQRGPDADHPPWAGHDDGERRTGGHQARPIGGEPAGDGGDEDDETTSAELEERQLAALAGSLPPPPKRTGVFVEPDSLRSHVGDLLRSFLGGYQVDAWGNFTFVHEQARVFVTVGMSPIGPQVGVFSITNLEITLSPKLAAFLLEINHKLGFGSFSYDSENEAVWLRHTLLGTTLDGPELQTTVAAVASTAAHFDDIIRDRFGGRSFHDAPEDVQKATKPPDTPTQPYPNASGYL